NRLGGGDQLLVSERDGVIEQAVDDVIARLRQPGVELHLRRDLAAERVGIARGRLFVHRGQYRQAADLRVEQQLLAFGRQREGDELLRELRVLGVGDETDVGRDKGCYGGIDELDRKARGACRQAEEVDHDPDAELA